MPSMAATTRATAWRFPATRFFALEVTRDELALKVRARSQAMLENGLENEVRGLLAAGVSPGAKPMLSIGYKECVDTFAGREPAHTLADRISQATMRLAKQQRTWFRGEAGVEWLPAPHREHLYARLGLS